MSTTTRRSKEARTDDQWDDHDPMDAGNAVRAADQLIRSLVGEAVTPKPRAPKAPRESFTLVCLSCRRTATRGYGVGHVKVGDKRITDCSRCGNVMHLVTPLRSQGRKAGESLYGGSGTVKRINAGGGQ